MEAIVTSKETIKGHIDYELSRWDMAQDDLDLNSHRWYQAVSIQSMLVSVQTWIEGYTGDGWDGAPETLPYEKAAVQYSIGLFSEACASLRNSSQYREPDARFIAEAKAEGQISVAKWFAFMILNDKYQILSY